MNMSAEAALRIWLVAPKAGAQFAEYAALVKVLMYILR